MFSVRDKLAKYNKNEVARAEKVKELMWNLGVTTTSQLIKHLRSSKIEEPGCSPVYMNIAIDIWGPDLAGLKGKSTTKKNIFVVINLGQISLKMRISRRINFYLVN